MILFFLLLLPYTGSAADCVDCGTLQPGASAEARPFAHAAYTAEKLAGKCEVHLAARLPKEMHDANTAIDLLIRDVELGSKSPGLLEETYGRFATLAPDAKLGCQEIEDIRYLADALRFRANYLSTLSESLEGFPAELARKPEHEPAEQWEKTSCLVTCLQKSANSLLPVEPQHACAKSCGTDQKFLSSASSSGITAYMLSKTCTGAGAGGVSKQQFLELSSALQKEESTMEQRFLKAWKKNERILEAARIELEKKLPAVEKMAAKHGKTRCGLDSAMEKAALATYELSLPPLGNGSAFYFSGVGKKFLASARHVPAADDPESAELMEVIAMKDGEESAVIDFNEPGSVIDIQNDAVIQGASAEKISLPTAPANSPLQRGENVAITGFAGIRNGNLTSFRCKFLGYAKNEKGEYGYSLDCPAEAALRGVSGGPLTDSRGQARGIVITHNVLEGAVMATPLAISAKGKVQLGVKEKVAGESCYGSGSDLGPLRRCAINVR